MKFLALLGAMALWIAALPAHADVVDSSAGGFTLKISLTIQAAPHEVYTKLMHIGEWWSPDHTYSHDAHNLSLDADAKGCFCEKLPNGGSVRHMDVVMVVPDKSLVMRGALGPLIGMGALCAMTIALAPSGESTKLDVTLGAGGYMPGGLNTIAATIDRVLSEQFQRLKDVAEHKAPAAKK